MSSRAKRNRPATFTRYRLWVVTAIAIAALILADQNGLLLVRDVDDLSAYHGQRVTVVRVIDGDTVEALISDSLHDRPATRIRLWGIDCPESAHNGEPAQPWAEPATEFATLALADSQVILWLESHRTRDVYGRVLAHLELEDGTSLNEALLEAGLARADNRWPHMMLTRYAQAEISARRRGIGIWSGETPEF